MKKLKTMGDFVVAEEVEQVSAGADGMGQRAERGTTEAR